MNINSKSLGCILKSTRTGFSIFLIVYLCGFSITSKATVPDKNIHQDSIEIIDASLGFYNWYLSCLQHDSTYNIVQPNYHWKDKVPIVDVNAYLLELKKLGIVSDFFIESEKNRFQICQDSLKHINYKAAMDCGCSVGEFFTVCSFLDSFYWFSSQEKPDGCELKKIEISGHIAICQLIFFWDSELSNGKHYDENFDCKVNLTKHDTKWLIENIIIKRNERSLNKGYN
jgi:hypothetical protein